MNTYTRLAISDLNEFVFGRCPRPLALRNGLVIGNGPVYPELNFTLPVMEISAGTMPEVRSQYTQMITEACQRAVELETPGLVVEFELLPELTRFPEWGAEITAILRDHLTKAEAAHGIRTALRVTPNDIREFDRPPRLRTGDLLEGMMRSFDLCAAAGADMLAIESTGGKEVHDDAIVTANLPLSVFALGVLGSRDMAFLWDRIVAVCTTRGVAPSGDSACGFANTAMVLAEQKSIPRVWAALIRVMSVARSLVAFERGAVGPSKDCAYEGVYLKAITGCPVSLEGSEAACAHFSPIGNIAKAVADLWSNESVQNVKLLGGMAPTVSLEQLVYATRLMNVASAGGPESARQLRDWLVQSDAGRDPQAYVLRPDVALEISREILEEPTPYLRTRRAALSTLARFRKALSDGSLAIPKTELRWLDRFSREADALPDDEARFTEAMTLEMDPARIRLDEYAL